MTNADMLSTDAERQPIVTVKSGEVFADSRNVAAFFGKEHRRLLQTIRELHCSDKFRQHNFVPFKINDLSGESTSHVEMTKDGFAFVVLGFTGHEAAKFKEAYIERFNVMESELRSRPMMDPMQALNDPAAMRGLLLSYSEKVLALEADRAVMQPKIEALDRIADSEGSMCVTDAAKTLQITRNALFRWLRTSGWVYRRIGTNHDVAYQSRIASGCLIHKVEPYVRNDGSDGTRTQVRVTAKGLTVLAEAFPLAVRAA